MDCTVGETKDTGDRAIQTDKRQDPRRGLGQHQATLAQGRIPSPRHRWPTVRKAGQMGLQRRCCSGWNAKVPPQGDARRECQSSNG